MHSTNTSGANVTLAPPQYTLWVYDFDGRHIEPATERRRRHEIVDPLFLQARKPAPTFIPDATPTGVAQQTLVNDSVGMLDISSVYDFDGVDTAKPSIAAQANPNQAAFYTRPARFIRIEKAVEIPDKTVRKINASAFGPAGMGMREILGYAPIQPDGSVQIQVPANVPFTIDVLDANARRITAQHTSWLQVLAGRDEILQRLPHRQPDGPNLAWPLGLDAAGQSGRTHDGSAVSQHESSVVRKCRRDHGADPGAHQLCEGEHDSLLADPLNRRHLREPLDHRRHAAGGERR